MLSQERISRTSEIDASPDYIVNIINKDDGAFDINEETNENSIHAIELQEKIEHE